MSGEVTLNIKMTIYNSPSTGGGKVINKNKILD